MPTGLPRFHILLVAPDGYQHFLALAELVETLAHAFLALGQEITFGLNQPRTDAINIVLGAHMATPALSALFPPFTVIFNIEQVEPDSCWMQGELPKLVSRYPTWDYSGRNMENWRLLLPEARVSLLPIGYVPALTRIMPAAHQDIDILFYGSPNERRLNILRQLMACGVRLRVETNCYGAERDALIARSRIVLNIHACEAHVFEIVRVSYLLANRKAVVGEVGPDTDINPALHDAIAATPYEGLVDTCMALLADDERRLALEQRGFDIMSSVDAVTAVRERVTALLQDQQAQTAWPGVQ